ncbi:hypothetical protein DRN93_00610 [archaeon]|nr:MAG: hypothetical protein DRN93_00610 [archaeon]
MMVNPLFKPYQGGIERHLYEVTSRLARKQEVNVITALLKGTEKEENIGGIKVHRCKSIVLTRLPKPLPPPYITSAHVKDLVLKFLTEVDIVHLHTRFFPEFSIPPLWYSKRIGKPVLLTLHNAKPKGISLGIDLGAHIYDVIIGNFILRNVDTLIAVSRYSAAVTVPKGFKGNVEIVPNGVDTTEFNPQVNGENIRSKYNNDYLLLYVGRLVKQKGLDYLIKAMNNIEDDAGLMVVGRGPELSHLKELVWKLDLEKRIFFEGFVKDALLPAYYAAADVFVLPSLWEPFGMVLLEAMATGRAIAASRVGGIPEILGGEAGLLFNPRDSYSITRTLNILLSDESLRKNLGNNGRERALKYYSWEKVVEKLENVYNKVLST